MPSTNRLARETSPYLRQHAENPVDWFPWGPEAFALAADRDRPILLSVGYSACHWCHVMAHECFEDAEVAGVMNELFVNIKVDREERPDVDSVYMEAVQAMTGRGGWPMTVFMAPDGRPFYGGTYFPKGQFLQLLRAVDDAWRDKRSDLLDHADHLTEAIGSTSRMTPATELPGVDQLNAALQKIAQSFDAVDGGFGRAPKFPSTMTLEVVLRAFRASGGAGARQVIETTLDAMASGGIYDHLGGGFARYSVDNVWLVPHFEKMLYDQALLARVYLHAWLVFGETRWLQVATETIDYVRRDLRHPAGGFYSAEDADSEGHEGKFYVWTADEIRAVLASDPETADPADIESALTWWGVTTGGNFEGANILNRPLRGDLHRPPAVERARARLFAHREGRVRPGLDDKVLTEWNALMLATIAEAAAATGNATWLAAAVANADFLCANLRRADGRWLRSWQAEGGARHLALAADLAALVGAFIEVHRATGAARWIDEAIAAADQLLDSFWDDLGGGLYTTGSYGEALVVRQKDVVDNATPSANSLAAVAFQRLSALSGDDRYAGAADDILALVGEPAARSPLAFANLLQAVDQRRTGATEICVAGDRPDLVAVVHQRYLPEAVLAWGERFESPLWEGRKDGLAYVCRDYTCAAPVDSADALSAALDRP